MVSYQHIENSELQFGPDFLYSIRVHTVIHVSHRMFSIYFHLFPSCSEGNNFVTYVFLNNAALAK